MSALRALCLAAVSAVALSSAAGASTFPIAAIGTEGKSVFASLAGEVVATYRGNSANYSNNLWLVREGQADLFLFNNYKSKVGDTVSLGSFTPGTELVFRLEVTNTKDNFFTGSASRNADGKAHARAQGEWKPGETLVSFEDLLRGPFDYNDMSFSFTNTISAQPAPVPLPAGGLLLATGLGIVAAVRRRKSR